MPRNFQRRVEVMFPVEDEGLRDRVIDEILAIALKDNVKARRLMSDGRYVRGQAEAAADGEPAETSLRSQYRFMELAREKAQAGPPLPGAGGHVPRASRRRRRARDAAAGRPPLRRRGARPPTSS